MGVQKIKESPTMTIPPQTGPMDSPNGIHQTEYYTITSSQVNWLRMCINSKLPSRTFPPLRRWKEGVNLPPIPFCHFCFALTLPCLRDVLLKAFLSFLLHPSAFWGIFLKPWSRIAPYSTALFDAIWFLIGHFRGSRKDLSSVDHWPRMPRWEFRDSDSLSFLATHLTENPRAIKAVFCLVSGIPSIWGLGVQEESVGREKLVMGFLQIC